MQASARTGRGRPGWARRALAVSHGVEAQRDYADWLADYVENWVRYVGETIPRVVFGDAIRERLTARAAHWVAEARANR